MAEAPFASVVHALPGRVRLRLPVLQGDVSRMSALALAVTARPNVAKAQAFAMTGSLLILHGGALDLLLDDAAAAGLFTLLPVARQGAGAPQLPTEALLPAAGAVAAAGLAALQLLRRDALPPALTLGWYAITLAQVAIQRGAALASLGERSKDAPPAAE